MQKYRETILAADEQGKDDFNGVVAVVTAAARIGVAKPEAACIASALPVERETLFAEHQKDVDARIKANKATCLANFETGVSGPQVPCPKAVERR